MKQWNRLRQHYLVVSDIVIVLIAGVLLRGLLSRLKWDLPLNNDQMSLLLAGLSAVSLSGYLSLISSMKSENAKRLFKSQQYKNILLIFIFYFVAAIVVFFVQLVRPSPKLSPYICMLFVVAFYRFVWVFVKTIGLLRAKDTVE